MIFVGLREYVDTSYPGQTLYPNDFKYNFINKFVPIPPVPPLSGFIDVDGTDQPLADGGRNSFFNSYIAV